MDLDDIKKRIYNHMLDLRSVLYHLDQEIFKYVLQHSTEAEKKDIAIILEDSVSSDFLVRTSALEKLKARLKKHKDKYADLLEKARVLQIKNYSRLNLPQLKKAIKDGQSHQRNI